MLPQLQREGSRCNKETVASKDPASEDHSRGVRIDKQMDGVSGCTEAGTLLSAGYYPYRPTSGISICVEVRVEYSVFDFLISTGL